MQSQKYKYKYGLFFARTQSFRYMSMGVNIEISGNSVCILGMNKLNNIVYCAVPLGKTSRYRNCEFRVNFVNDHMAAISVSDVKILIDYEKKAVAVNQALRVHGEVEKWGMDISVPWTDKYEGYFA